MELSFTMDKIEGVDPAIAGLYTQQDGKYILTGITGIAPKSKVDEFRTNNIALTDKLKSFEGIDPVKYKAMDTELAELKIRLEKTGLDDEQIAKIVAGRVEQMKKTYDENEVKYKTTIDGLSNQVNTLMIDNAAKEAAVAHGIQESALTDTINRVRQVFSVVDGKTIGKENGQVLFDVTGQKELTINEWVKGLAKTAPHLFKESVRSKLPNNFNFTGDTSKLSPMQKISQGLSR